MPIFKLSQLFKKKCRALRNYGLAFILITPTFQYKNQELFLLFLMDQRIMGLKV